MGGTCPLHAEAQALPVESGIEAEHILRAGSIAGDAFVIAVHDIVPVEVGIHCITRIHLLVWLRQLGIEGQRAVRICDEIAVLIQADVFVETGLTAG